jgi:hypothetical protein
MAHARTSIHRARVVKHVVDMGQPSQVSESLLQALEVVPALKIRARGASFRSADPPVVRSRRAGTPTSQGLVTAPACRQVRLPQPP